MQRDKYFYYGILRKTLSLCGIVAMCVFGVSAEAVLYSAGETLSPACAPSESNCGVEVPVAVDTGSSVPPGSTLVASATGTWSTLPLGLDGQVLKISGGSIVWGSASSSASYFASGQGIALSTSTSIFSLVLDGTTLTQSGAGVRLSTTYPGQATINTLGNIATGSWQATVIAPLYGGTGATSTPSNGQILIGNGTTYSVANISSSGGVLITNGAGSLDVGLSFSGLAATTSLQSGDYFLVSASGTNRKLDYANLKSVWDSAIAVLGGQKEDIVASGTTAQYYRGDKTWQTLNTDVVPETSSTPYYADARARSAISIVGPALSYASTTGVLSILSTYAIPLVGSGTGDTLVWNSGANNWVSSNLLSVATSTGTVSVGGALTSNSFSNSGIATSSGFVATANGISLQSSTPSSTVNSLYNVGGVLMWNGSSLTGGGTSTSTFAYVNATSTSATSSFAGNVAISGNSTLSTSSIAALTVTGTSTLAGITGSNLIVIGLSSFSTTTATGLTLTQQGLALASSTPVVTTNTLYNNGGTLMWNGSAVGASTSTPAATSTFAYITATSTTATSSFAGALVVSGNALFATTTINSQLNANSGVALASYTPGVTTNMLYNAGGALYWNGSLLGVAGAGLQYLNGISTSTQLLATGVSGADFNIISSGNTHTFNIPDAGAGARGFVSTSSQIFAGNKTFTGTTTLATSSITSLTVTGTSTLAGISGTSLFVTGVSNLSTSTLAALTVTGTSTLAGITGSNLIVTGLSSFSTTTATGLTLSQQGLALASAIPLVTTNTLYNNGGTLMWNGSAVGASTSTPAGTSTFAYVTATSTTATSTFAGNVTISGNAVLSTSSITALRVTGTSTLTGISGTSLFVTGVSNLSTSTLAALTVTGTSTLAGITGSNLIVTGLSSFSTTTATGLTLTQQGLALASAVPLVTSNTLYNNAGTLMWNGSAVGGGGALSGGQQGYLPYWTGASSLGTSTLYFATSTGNIGVGMVAPTSALHLKAGTSATGTSPLKFTAGTNLATPEAGSVEFDGANLYFTATDTRETLTTKTYADTKLGLSTISDIGEISGFVDGSNINVSYDYTNRTVTLTGNLDYYWKGTKHTLASPWTSSAHANTEGTWFLSTTDGTTFTWSLTPWTFSAAQVALVNRKSTAAMSFVVRETHGTMDSKSHEIAHSQIGTYRYTGGQLTAGTYAVNTASDAANSPGFDAAVIKDEDNTTSIPAWSEGTYTTMYIGASSTAIFSTTSTLPFTAAGSYIQVNNPSLGTMTAGINNRYYNVYQIMIPVGSESGSQKFRAVMLQPQATYTSLSAATGEDVRSLDFGNLSQLSNEFIVYSRITYYTATGDTNTGKARIATGGVTYVVGNRSSQVSVAGFTSNNHAILSNLTWLTSGHIGNVSTIAGFDGSGNATELSTVGTGSVVLNNSPTFLTSAIIPLLIGGTSTTQDLSFQTTSGVGAAGADMHFLVGNNGATEAITILNNGNVGVGTTSPSSMFAVAGTSTLSSVAATSLYVTGVSSFSSSVISALTVTGTSTLTGLTASNISVTGLSNFSTTTASGLTLSQQGLALSSSTPVVTTNTLYNNGGTLMWNGAAVGASASTSTFAYITATSTIATSSFAGNVTVSGNTVLSTSSITALRVTGTSTLAGISGTSLFVTGAANLSTSTLAALTVISTSTLAGITGSSLTITGLSNFSTTTASGLTLTQQGLALASSIPLVTTNTLYNNGGTLMWNGGAIGGAGGLSGGTTGYLSAWTSPTTLSTSTLYFATSTGHFGLGTTTPTSMLELAGGDGALLGLSRSAEGIWIDFKDGAKTFALYNTDSTSSPEGIKLANAGSMMIDSTGGNVYIKTTSATTTGWQKLQRTADVLNRVTGWVDGGTISINGGDNTKLDITAGSAEFVDYSTNPNFPVVKRISWGTQTALNPALATRTKWVGVRDNGSGVAEFVFDTNFDSTERRTIAILGRVRNDAGTVPAITNVDDYKRPAFGVLTAVQDFLLEFGSWSVSGNALSANGANMKLNKSAGKSFRYEAERVAGQENVHTDAAQAPIGTLIYHRDGIGTTTPRTTLDSFYYNNGGATSSVATNRYQVQEVYIFPVSGNVHVRYGTAVYTSLALAESAVYSAPSGVTAELLDGSYRAASIVMRGQITNLTTAIAGGDAKIIPRGVISGSEGTTASYWTRSGTNLLPATSGDDVLLDAGSALSIADMATGSIPFFGGAGLLSQDNANLYWNNTSKRLGIGTSSPAYMLSMGTGGGYYNQSTGAWTNGSDRSYKDNIVDLSKYGLDTIKALRPVSYTVKESGIEQVGFIAQEVKDIVPELVSGEEGSMGLNYSGLTPILTKAMQEQNALIFGTSTGLFTSNSSVLGSSLASALFAAKSDIASLKETVAPNDGVSLIWSQDISHLIHFDGFTGSTTVVSSSSQPISIPLVLDGLNTRLTTLNGSILAVQESILDLSTRDDTEEISLALRLAIDDISALRNSFASTSAQIASIEDMLSLGDSASSSIETLEGVAPQTFIDRLKQAFSEWFGNVENHIEKFFAKSIESESVITKELCVQSATGEKTCVTKDQLDALLTIAGQSAASGEPPVETVGAHSTTTVVLPEEGEDEVPGASTTPETVEDIIGEDSSNVVAATSTESNPE